MIEKITPSNVTSISTGKKQSIQNTSASDVRFDDTEATASDSAQSSTQVKNRINSAYLQARDVQSNISFQQSRNSALMDVSSKLQDLRNLAMQYKNNDLSLPEQDAIVAKAEQALYSIDQKASSSQFLGTKVISDADSRELGLEVINLESGDPVGQINSAMKKVAAKLAANNAQTDTADVRLDNIKKSATDAITEFQAEMTAKSIIKAIQDTSPDVIYKDIDPSKTADLLGI
ncbi:hypothetical protein [Seleniivibrio sp.]|uniref:hypothetical protein n=1 Tax=Seleniivibrio sp. TaxID=2898801 RepID=UPI0025CE6DC7|nr:hypothetical protein [Seleniivibrio sp.]MCD8553041.1 hypothetical protein [Seleniivibrio sp.]